MTLIRHSDMAGAYKESASGQSIPNDTETDILVNLEQYNNTGGAITYSAGIFTVGAALNNRVVKVGAFIVPDGFGTNLPWNRLRVRSIGGVGGTISQSYPGLVGVDFDDSNSDTHPNHANLTSHVSTGFWGRQVAGNYLVTTGDTFKLTYRHGGGAGITVGEACIWWHF